MANTFWRIASREHACVLAAVLLATLVFEPLAIHAQQPAVAPGDVRDAAAATAAAAVEAVDARGRHVAVGFVLDVRGETLVFLAISATPMRRGELLSVRALEVFEDDVDAVDTVVSVERVDAPRAVALARVVGGARLFGLALAQGAPASGPMLMGTATESGVVVRMGAADDPRELLELSGGTIAVAVCPCGHALGVAVQPSTGERAVLDAAALAMFAATAGVR